MRHSRGRAQQAGLALISVLVMVALMTIIMAGIFYRHQLDITRAVRVLGGEQALLMAISAESWALSIFSEDETDVDHLDEDWAREIPPLPIEGGFVSGKIIDLQGRFNLNNFASYNKEAFQGHSQQLSRVNTLAVYLRLLEQLELDALLQRNAAAGAVIVDWIDNNRELTSPDSAEDDEYYREGKSYVTAATMLVEPAELGLLQGYSADDAIALMPFVAALPETTSINVNTAEPEVLMALHDYIDEQAAQDIMAARPYENINDFYAELDGLITVADGAKKVFGGSGLGLSINSNYYLLVMDVILSDVQLKVESYVQRLNDGKTAVLFRRMSYIPPYAVAGVESSTGTDE